MLTTSITDILISSNSTEIIANNLSFIELKVYSFFAIVRLIQK